MSSSSDRRRQEERERLITEELALFEAVWRYEERTGKRSGRRWQLAELHLKFGFDYLTDTEKGYKAWVEGIEAIHPDELGDALLRRAPTPYRAAHPGLAQSDGEKDLDS